MQFLFLEATLNPDNNDFEQKINKFRIRKFGLWLCWQHEELSSLIEEALNEKLELSSLHNVRLSHKSCKMKLSMGECTVGTHFCFFLHDAHNSRRNSIQFTF
jgi:hypothetical protein